MQKFTPILATLASVVLIHAKQEQRSCASHVDKGQEELSLHLKSGATVRAAKLSASGRSSASVLPDIANIAHLNAADGVIARRNPFNLNAMTIRFVPSEGTRKYRYEVAPDSMTLPPRKPGPLCPVWAMTTLES